MRNVLLAVVFAGFLVGCQSATTISLSNPLPGSVIDYSIVGQASMRDAETKATLTKVSVTPFESKSVELSGGPEVMLVARVRDATSKMLIVERPRVFNLQGSLKDLVWIVSEGPDIANYLRYHQLGDTKGPETQPATRP